MEATLEKTQFSKVIREYQYPTLIKDVDLGFYNTRKIHKLFKANRKLRRSLDITVINLAHNPDGLALGARDYYINKSIRFLESKNFIYLLKHHHYNPNGLGSSRVYATTDLFKVSLRLSLPSSIRISHSKVNKGLAISHYLYYWQKLYLKSGMRLKNWMFLAKNVRLSLSNGEQVDELVYFNREKARLFSKGRNHYQGLSKKVRPFLLFDGDATREPDFRCLHPNICLNLAGFPCEKFFYEKIMRDLGIRKSKARRDALKLLVLLTLNIGSKSAFTKYCLAIGLSDKKLKQSRKIRHATKVLGLHPSKVYKSVIKCYPMLEPYVCNGKHALRLQEKDAEIMDSVLETLASDDILALPLHDSIIVKEKYFNRAKDVMRQSYKEIMGFEIDVK